VKITKLEHSCLDIVDGDSRLIIDPGVFTKTFTDLSGITAVVITHIHPDHYDPKKLESIIGSNHNVQIYTTEEVAKDITSVQVIVPEHQKTYNAGSLTLEFFGEKHGVIDPTMVVQNMGVLVNQVLYYPGDSLTLCDENFRLLAIPTAAPWLTTSDLPNFIGGLDCKQIFPAHDGLLNEAGQTTYRNWLSIFAKAKDKEFLDIKPGQSIEA